MEDCIPLIPVFINDDPVKNAAYPIVSSEPFVVVIPGIKNNDWVTIISKWIEIDNKI